MTVPGDHGQYSGATVPEGYEATARMDPAAEPGGYRDEAVAERRTRFGGVKVGSAFFGWVTATGMTVILTALLAGVGAAVGAATGAGVGTATVNMDPGALGVAGAIVLGVVVLLSYFCGGYVAGRMARFSGAKQGVAVWLWALVFAVVGTIVGLVVGNNLTGWSTISGLPQVPIGQADLTMAGVAAVVGVALVSLLGAILGGLAGMRYHRTIDRAALGE
jgi:hypothetical protein